MYRAASAGPNRAGLLSVFKYNFALQIPLFPEIYFDNVSIFMQITARCHYRGSNSICDFDLGKMFLESRVQAKLDISHLTQKSQPI